MSQQSDIHRVATKMLDNRPIGPRNFCACCGRKLDDAASLKRGIGPECWQDILQAYRETSTSTEQ